MSHLNVEIKARCSNPEKVRSVLEARGADFRGVDHQVDTYFRSPQGRLKLREGNIENNLIHYQREDASGPKQSIVTLYRPDGDSGALKEALAQAMGVLVVVEKDREIYFIDNVKFHVDSVKGLGSFLEIEAIDESGDIGRQRLQDQCEAYMEALGVGIADLITVSYSDLLLEKDA